ncbi:uncharacterized protein FIESC28_04715 [Fusarium coffeatum]|uniref:Uncharacterized protein n=1 Tax=Fusarium coffeatum TaxID=231269 RepID=A0A366RYL9_9HYPO|nr:uncharacterized protein FIESC28_04715 [Fusarium coffeatum]RBR21872.1 hypothetical protein FIESC28_04715 [Fusarium coffeatum]
MAPTVIVGLILGCALLGGYTSMFTSYKHGFFDAIRVCNAGEKACVLDMTDSVSRRITGSEQVVAMINLLLEFFSQGLRKSPDAEGMDLEALVAFVYLAAQFGGAWYLVALEGLRFGNRGTILSWTGTFGIVFQAVTITIIAPVYLTLQLLLSPSNPRQAHLLVDPADLNFLPVATIISYVLPTIGLCLPLVFDLSREAKFIAVALWQPFPLYQSALQSLWRQFTRGEGDKGHVDLRHTTALNRAYMFITTLTVSVHFIVMGTIAASWVGLVQPLSAHHILALTSIADPPTMVLFAPPVSAMESREIVVSFLRWDVYCTCLSMIIWSGYQLYATRRSPSAVAIVVKVILFTLVGGPIFPALMLLWQRDDIVMGGREAATMKKHN